MKTTYKFILFYSLLYIGTAYGVEEINPLQWKGEVRITWAFFIVGIGFYFFAEGLDDLQKRKKKHEE